MELQICTEQKADLVITAEEFRAPKYYSCAYITDRSVFVATLYTAVYYKLFPTTRPQQQDNLFGMAAIKRTVVRSIPLPQLPGWESQLILLEFPPGTKAPLHTHPVPGMTYILEGTLISQYEGEEEKTCVPGDSLIDHANTLHLKGENPSDTEWVKMLINYVVQTGQPTIVLA